MNGDDCGCEKCKHKEQEETTENQIMPSLFEKMLSLFSFAANADQGRHPGTGQFQGTHAAAAMRGFDEHAAVEGIGKQTNKDGRNVTSIQPTSPAKMVESGEVDDHQINDAPGTPGTSRLPGNLIHSMAETYNIACAVLNAKPEVSQVFNVADELAYNQAWPQEKRDKLPESDFAGPSQTYPIGNQQDLDWAISLLGRAEDQGMVQRKLTAIANRKKLTLPATWNAFPPSMPNPPMAPPVSPIGGAPPAVSPDMAHSFTKQAAGASLQTENDKAFGQAQGAMSSSAQGDSDAAMGQHVKAASAHEKAAVTSMKDGDQGTSDSHLQAAALHRKAAAMHAAVNNQQQGDAMSRLSTNMPAGGAFEGAKASGYPAAQAAAMAGKLEGSYEGGGEASDTSAEARSASKEASRTGSAKAHKAAAAAHRDAADSHREKGNTEHAAAHEASAKSHDRAAKKATNNQLIVDDLIANGHLNSAVKEQVLQTLNTADVSGSGTFDSAVQVGGNDDDDDADDEFTSKVKIKKGSKFSQNSGILANATPEERNWIQRNLQREQREKLHLIQNMTGHLQGPAKQRMVANLSTKSIQEIEELSLLRGPVHNQEQQVLQPMFLGAAGLPAMNGESYDGTNNADNDLLDLPTMNEMFPARSRNNHRNDD